MAPTTAADLALFPAKLLDEPLRQLLVAKVTEIEERRENPARLQPKDGLDALRLL